MRTSPCFCCKVSDHAEVFYRIGLERLLRRVRFGCMPLPAPFLRRLDLARLEWVNNA
jgi:hypothetical protein